MLFHYLFFPNENYLIYKLPLKPSPSQKKEPQENSNEFAFTAGSFGRMWNSFLNSNSDSFNFLPYAKVTWLGFEL